MWKCMAVRKPQQLKNVHQVSLCQHIQDFAGSEGFVGCWGENVCTIVLNSGSWIYKM